MLLFAVVFGPWKASPGEGVGVPLSNDDHRRNGAREWGTFDWGLENPTRQILKCAAVAEPEAPLPAGANCGSWRAFK
jgi:hypothetical protein